MKKRLLYYKLIKYLDHKNALIITGMRQVGKTTLLRQVFEQVKQPKLWFDFDNPLDQKTFEDIDYDAIYKRLFNLTGGQSKKIAVFIDEIQNHPEITSIVKYLIDHYAVKFFLTGSSNYYLKNLFPESLSGRKFLFQLNPLSFLEFLYFKDKIDLKFLENNTLYKTIDSNNLFVHKTRQEEYEQYLRFGGFPEVVTTSDIDTKKLVLRNTFASFFEKDIRLLSDYTDIRELRDLILLLVPRVGSLLDVTKLASELGVDRVKIYRFLEFLQGMFFIRLLPRFSHSVDRAVAGGKKVYFTDTGILNSIGAVNDAQLFENAVLNQLCEYGKVSFYNKRNTAEIDAILDNKIAFEIKLNGVQRDLEKLSKLSNSLEINQSYVISKNYQELLGIISPVIL